MQRTTASGQLRALLESGQTISAAGCFDPFSALIAQRAGFDVVYMTGNGTSAARLGSPDVGLLTMPEMADQAQRICDAVEVPVVADADTGYGNALNVIRTVVAYERAGVAALHLEDQTMPKRCGHLAGKQLIPAQEHASKIRAALEARSDDGPLIIGRTDAVSVEGVGPALERARAYGEAGADLLFVEGLETEADIASAAELLADWPLVYAWLEGRGPELSVDQLGELGVDLVIFPLTAVLATLANLERVYSHLRETGSSTGMELATFEQFNHFMGAGEAAELEQRYSI